MSHPLASAHPQTHPPASARPHTTNTHPPVQPSPTHLPAQVLTRWLTLKLWTRLFLLNLAMTLLNIDWWFLLPLFDPHMYRDDCGVGVDAGETGALLWSGSVPPFITRRGGKVWCSRELLPDFCLDSSRRFGRHQSMAWTCLWNKLCPAYRGNTLMNQIYGHFTGSKYLR